MFKFIKKLFCDHKWELDYKYFTRFDLSNGGQEWELIAKLNCTTCGKEISLRSISYNKYKLLAELNSYLPKHKRLEFIEE